jgi:hypothetical protein
MLQVPDEVKEACIDNELLVRTIEKTCTSMKRSFDSPADGIFLKLVTAKLFDFLKAKVRLARL